jgi:hypothetical protein
VNLASAALIGRLVQKSRVRVGAVSFWSCLLVLVYLSKLRLSSALGFWMMTNV